MMKRGAERILRRGGGLEEVGRLNRQAIQVLQALQVGRHIVMRFLIEYFMGKNMGRTM